MFECEMVNNNKCKRWDEVETHRHLLWENREVKKIWQAFNELTTNINQQEEKVQDYDNIFEIGNMGASIARQNTQGSNTSV
jgi:hypothetical protein